MPNILEVLKLADRRRNEIYDLVEKSGGELTPDLEAELKIVDLTTATKIDAMKFVFDKLENEATRINEAADQLYKHAKGLLRAREYLRALVLEAMRGTLKSELHGNYYKLKAVACKKSLQVDKTKLDPEYFMQAISLVPDKIRIQEALESGKEVTGATLEGGLALRTYAFSDKE